MYCVSGELLNLKNKELRENEHDEDGKHQDQALSPRGGGWLVLHRELLGCGRGEGDAARVPCMHQRGRALCLLFER